MSLEHTSAWCGIHLGLPQYVNGNTIRCRLLIVNLYNIITTSFEYGYTTTKKPF
uniref:Uncharacterized protein n=1 Tax=Arundo donax TaxID=35708 RepID=A0A0A9AK74_ARUDO